VENHFKFKKHQMRPGINKMMGIKEINIELGDLLEKPKKLFDEVWDLLGEHRDRMKKLADKDPSFPYKDDETRLLRGMAEFCYLGYIVSHIKKLDEFLEQMCDTKQNMLMNECVHDYIKDETKKLGPSIDDIRRKMKEIEKETGMTPEQLEAEFRRMAKYPEGN
jgi:hypothetical protein